MLRHLQDLYGDHNSVLFKKAFSAQTKRNIINCILLALYNLSYLLRLRAQPGCMLNKQTQVCVPCKERSTPRHGFQQSKPKVLFSEQDINQRRHCSGSVLICMCICMYACGCANSLRNSPPLVTHFVCPAPLSKCEEYDV